ncbi:hypothetical protein EV378_0993 [Pseudonocardia endophytica]|uniref:Uncharacterized protein n=1 Tax=Pseudonocardia endophytica TaxID=401976 RepID=A0A4R1HUZ6_PSEEN|nr:hypothetical protein EV378_0993 [Pseudonocardia endophytica]
MSAVPDAVVDDDPSVGPIDLDTAADLDDLLDLHEDADV